MSRIPPLIEKTDSEAKAIQVEVRTPDNKPPLTSNHLPGYINLQVYKLISDHLQANTCSLTDYQPR
eukprot:gene10406-2537_t